uniref:Uncharacterized protein n=1 Tax=Lactuca sativa TaxID=4236 RepID=A0A9R1XLN9_LACSA|nr:hypothetical protein LSAT_V11C300145240 [Lactuca sativa]
MSADPPPTRILFMSLFTVVSLIPTYLLTVPSFTASGDATPLSSNPPPSLDTLITPLRASKDSLRDPNREGVDDNHLRQLIRPAMHFIISYAQFFLFFYFAFILSFLFKQYFFFGFRYLQIGMHGDRRDIIEVQGYA